jgi:hypothetical protein
MQQKEDLIHQSDHPVLDSPKRSKKLTMILTSVLLLTMFGIGGYWLGARRQQLSPSNHLTKPRPTWLAPATPSQQPSASPMVTTSQIDPRAGWKTYEDNKFAISYPANWRVGLDQIHSLQKQFPQDSLLKKHVMQLISPDFIPRSEISSSAQIGVFIDLYIGRQQFPVDNPLGLVSTRNTQWLEETAVLQVYKYEGNNLVLTAKHNNTDYQMVMTAPDNETRNAYESIFLLIADTLKVK